MTLDEILKDYRKKKGMTMQELAHKCGLSKGYISMLESNFKPTNTNKKIIPSITAIKKLSDGTGIDFDELLASVNGDVQLSKADAFQYKEETPLDYTPNTIAAHFDGDEYTEEELEEIRKFAEFVKQRRKRD